MKASTVAKKILKVYEKYGWCQRSPATDAHGDFSDVKSRSTTALCIMGAGWKANIGLAGFRALEKCFRNKNIAMYNDKPDRTFTQVKRKLRQIAAGDK